MREQIEVGNSHEDVGSPQQLGKVGSKLQIYLDRHKAYASYALCVDAGDRPVV
jgi:hypothetical protein